MIAALSLAHDPATRIAAFCTLVAHSSLGLPMRLTYLSDAGRKLPGQKTQSLSKLPTGARAAFPYNTSCVPNTLSDDAVCEETSKTLAFVIRDKYEGKQFQIFRKHWF